MYRGLQSAPSNLSNQFPPRLSPMEFAADLRYASRALLAKPAFAAAAAICLALGIGATTAIFSVVNAVVLRPLPYAQPERLARIYTEFPTFPNGGLRRFWTSSPEY